jgi:parvulin-like peptidyl-prolyl isomerase
MKKLNRLFFAVYILCIGISPLYAEDKIAAIVNNDAITQRDLNDFINFTRMQLSSEYPPEAVESKINSMKPDLLNKLIEDRIILQEAKKNNLKVDEERVKARIEEIRRRYGTDAAFQEALKHQGIVLADIQSRIREQILTFMIVEIKVRSKVFVSPNEVTTYYRDNNAEFRVPEQRELDAFITEDADKAQRIVTALRAGADAEKEARDESVARDTMTAKKGQLREDIEAAVFALKAGEVTEPLKTEEKYYVFRLQKIIPAMIQGLPQVRDKIYAFLYNKKMAEQMTAWLDGLKKHSYIKIFQN